jgi:2-phosphosulfolactate phosphatase
MDPKQIRQLGHEIRLDWGRAGARRAAERGDAVIIVDVLSFSTTVAAAVERGALIYPALDLEAAASLADRVRGELAGSREAAGFSLSPLSMAEAEPGCRIVLPSLNGSACTVAASGASLVIAACLLNASAAAYACANRRTTVVPCGERTDSREDGPMRFAIEDYLGAGAVLAGLAGDKSPGARLCEAAFTQNREELRTLIWESASGRELRERGFETDVTFALEVDRFSSVPVLRNGRYEALNADQALEDEADLLDTG